MNVSFTVTDPIMQKKILAMILGNRTSSLYDFSNPEVFKNLSDKLWDVLAYLASGPKSQSELIDEFGDKYYTYLSHITRRVNSVLKKYDLDQDWYEYDKNDKYVISREASDAINNQLANQS